MRLDAPVLDYFKAQAADTGLPYQTIINLYLRDCVNARRKLTFS
jgi:predicted DNA binding CopG/RHH family protein